MLIVLRKKAALRGMFTASKVSLIYGAAGTGKTKLIEHISKFHNERSKLYLANTHSAVSNLRSRITAQNTEFKTIRSFLNENGERTEFDILIIDECSVVSNIDMRDILRKASLGPNSCRRCIPNRINSIWKLVLYSQEFCPRIIRN